MENNKDITNSGPGTAGPRVPPRRFCGVTAMAAALGCVLFAALLALYFFPIYPDEIEVRLWLSRLPFDFPQKISGAPACLSTFCQSIPATMYVPGMINWLLHGLIGKITTLRVVGIGVALYWVAALAVYLIYRDEELSGGPADDGQARRRLLIGGTVAALFSAGVFPVFLISNRSEQLMLPSLAALLGIFIASRKPGAGAGARRKAGLALAYFVSVSLVLYGHGKGLFFVPFFVVVGWQVFRRAYGAPVFAAAMALLGVQCVQDYLAWKSVFRCPEVPAMQALFASFSIDPWLLFRAPGQFFGAAFRSLLNFGQYPVQLGFLPVTGIGYLPSLPLGPAENAANVLVRFDFAAAFAGLLAFLPFRYFRRDVPGRSYVSVNLALLALLGCALASGVFNLPKSWYDAGFMYALLLILLVFFAGENFPGLFRTAAARRVFVYLGCVALLSQALFISRNLPAFLRGYTGPGVSIARFDAEKVNADLSAAADACGLDPVHGRRIIVDDYSYLYFRRSAQPMPITYIFYKNDSKGVREFFSKADPGGLAVNCSSLGASGLAAVKRTGEACCISKEGLKALAAYR